ncbi:hypothetical protein BDZ94DRAFT_1268968 [Collybia nuda]|uniref:Uncharacterized protein n=1 Tax=Collybia nuda TaxID=64659 RepID=A0A9P5XYR3_9AGAR|nr:hypothetical protein BDZ94DRAFT_1268968 [Collybia nuda]
MASIICNNKSHMPLLVYKKRQPSQKYCLILDRSPSFTVPMTPQEAAIVHNFGNSVLINSVFLLPESLLYGVFIYLFAQSTTIFMRRGLRSWSSRILFTISLMSFILMGIHWTTYSAGLFISIKALVIDDPASFGDSKRLAGLGRQVFHIDVIENVVDQLPIYISDGIVIWRAWVLFSDDIWIMAVPGALFLGTIGTGLTYLSYMTSPLAFRAVQLREPVLPMKLVTANLALSFATNMVATLLIGYKLWVHRKSPRIKAIGSLSSAQKVLIALIESGTAYCTLQLVRTVLYCYPGPILSNQFYASGIVLSLATVATTMYPTVVIMLVNQQRTLVECFGLDAGLRGRGNPRDEEIRVATPGHLSFAHSTVWGTTQTNTASTSAQWFRVSPAEQKIEDRQIKTVPF